MSKLILAFFAFSLTLSSFAQVDHCSVYVDGNTNKATRLLKNVLAEKNYNIVENQEQAYSRVYSQREGCPVPLVCGGSSYVIYFQTHVPADTRDILYITGRWEAHKRSQSIEKFKAGLQVCQ